MNRLHCVFVVAAMLLLFSGASAFAIDAPLDLGAVGDFIASGGENLRSALNQGYSDASEDERNTVGFIIILLGMVLLLIAFAGHGFGTRWFLYFAFAFGFFLIFGWLGILFLVVPFTIGREAFRLMRRGAPRSSSSRPSFSRRTSGSGGMVCTAGRPSVRTVEPRTSDIIIDEPKPRRSGSTSRKSRGQDQGQGWYQ